VFHSDGSLAQAPIALCEVQGYVYAAKRGAARLASALGNHERAALLESEALNLHDRFHKAFWLEDLSTYALALDGRKQPCRVKTSNAGHCLYTGIATPEAARLTAQTLMANDSYSGWGVRTVASGQCRYNPISYHNGSIWPHDNSLIAAGLARYGFKSLAGRIFSDMCDASAEIELYRLPELFCGLHRRGGEGPTLYPVACSPQAWAAGSIFMFLQASLGLVLDAQRKQIRFEGPYLPEHFTQLWIKNLTLGTGSVDVLIERRSGMVRLQTLDKRGEVDVVVT
jgi:glycogen debranching enzyme